jgi:hypothetical protein
MVEKASALIGDARGDFAIGVMETFIPFGQDQGVENPFCIPTYSIRSAKVGTIFRRR